MKAKENPKETPETEEGSISEKKPERTEKTVMLQITDKAEVKSGKLEPYLIQISGRETGQPFNLSGRNIKIGRDPLSQIVLEDPHVSRYHAEIICRKENDIVIRDVGSTNGVFVNGKKITERKLEDGDKILIGTRLYFKFCFQDSVEHDYQQNLFRAANIDSLTQLYNKKYFVDALAKEFSFARRNQQPLSLLMVDIDFFKKINDTYGHLAGDLVLKSVGQFLLKHLRMENIACRYGGEEFAIILRNVNGDLALMIAERVRRAIETEKIMYRTKPISVTVSIGIATLENQNFETIEDFLRKADEYLYEAKESGRNRTVLKKAA